MRALPQLSEPMPIRLRKLIGAIMLIILVVAWALLAMALAQSPLVKANGASDRRAGLGVAGDAAHSLDVAPRRRIVMLRRHNDPVARPPLRPAPRQRRGAFGGA